jgi:hypothetical protein
MFGALGLTAAAGFLGATVVGAATGDPARTVTVEVGQPGPAGPAGPVGPAGPTGATGADGLACPAGFTAGELVLNSPGGQVRLWTCLGD